jgi:Immunity protein 27
MIDPNVKSLIGTWAVVDGSLQEDSVAQFINRLISAGLRKISVSDDGWAVLYQDPDDGRYWELSYPQSDLAGGGPPTLSFLSEAEAINRYGSALDS